MLALAIIAVLQTSAAPLPPPAAGAPARTGLCRGVHMPNGAEGANLISTTIAGPADKLADIAKRLTDLGARVTPRASDEIYATYTDDLDAMAIGGLLNAIDKGEFGPVTTKDFALPLWSLPADKCRRFKS